MRVLVTGGSGVVGAAAVTALLQRGHAVRLLSRNAAEDARQWSQGVSPWPGDVAIEASVEGAGDGCDAVLHIAGIAEESPPDTTFERVNVDGTRHVLREAERAGVARFVFVSSLGAERGESEYHRSKRAAEGLVRGFSREWVIVRPGATYGPGDEHISMLLGLVRTLPVIPLIGSGDQPFQPIWHEDLAEALAIAVERGDLGGQVLDLAGREVTSESDLIERMAQLTDRSPMVVPLPQLAASLGLRALSSLGLDVPISTEQITMLTEGNVLPPDRPNALTTIFGVKPTPLAEGLRKLLESRPEQLPSDGVGALKHKRYWADIRGGRYDAPALITLVRDRFGALLPGFVDGSAERPSPARIVDGETITLGLPVRGHVQVRVVETEPTKFTLLTVEGHPIAGAVRMLAQTRGDCVRFEVEVFERAATTLDFLMLRTLGRLLQDANWLEMVKNVAEASGGTTDGVERDSERLDEAQAARVDEWLKELTNRLKREEAGV